MLRGRFAGEQATPGATTAAKSFSRL